MSFKQQTGSNEVTLLLVGNTGNGKSATGNSILRQQVFKTTASVSSTTSEFKIESNTLDDVEITVVDGPGVDTDKSSEEVLNLSIENMKQALNLCNYRFSALVIVIKYGTRFTKQESDFIKTVKGILGKNVISDFGVCIMTHGDNFDADMEDNNLSFKEWCHLQEGEIQTLFHECNYRCVLFNNRTKDEVLKDSQVSELLAMVPRNSHYSKDDFLAADTDLQKLVIQTKAPQIAKETREFIESKRHEIKCFQTNGDIDEEIRLYEKIKTDVDNKGKSLIKEYRDADSIQQSLVDIKVFKLEMDSKVKNLNLKKQTDHTTVVPRSLPYNESDLKLVDTDLHKRFLPTKTPEISKETHDFIDNKRQEIKRFQRSEDINEEIMFYENIKSDVDNKERSLIEDYGEVDSMRQIKIFKEETDSKIKSLVQKQQTKEAMSKSCSRNHKSTCCFVI